MTARDYQAEREGAVGRQLPVRDARRRLERTYQRLSVWQANFESYSRRSEFLPPHMALTALEDIRAALAGELA